MKKFLIVPILLFAFSTPVFAADKFVSSAVGQYNYNNINSLKNLRASACYTAETMAQWAGEAGKPTRSENARVEDIGGGTFRVTCTVVKGGKK